MALVAEACPDIQKMIFKYNPEYFSSYLQVKIFLILMNIITNQLFLAHGFLSLKIFRDLGRKLSKFWALTFIGSDWWKA